MPSVSHSNKALTAPIEDAPVFKDPIDQNLENLTVETRGISESVIPKSQDFYFLLGVP